MPVSGYLKDAAFCWTRCTVYAIAQCNVGGIWYMCGRWAGDVCALTCVFFSVERKHYENSFLVRSTQGGWVAWTLIAEPISWLSYSEWYQITKLGNTCFSQESKAFSWPKFDKTQSTGPRCWGKLIDFICPINHKLRSSPVPCLEFFYGQKS